MSLSFEELVREVASSLYEALSKFEKVRVVSHIDADGLSSAGIFVSLLRHLGVPFHLSLAKYSSESLARRLLDEPYEVVVILDLGSGDEEFLRLLSKRGKEVFIIDHHRPPGEVPSGINMLNPFLSGLDGDTEVSSSGVAYLLHREITGSAEAAPIALVGALGDLQDDGGLSGLNARILEEAREAGLVEVRREIRLFGGPDYPLVASLERTIDPPIRGVTNDSAGALALVEALGIPIKVGDKWTTLSDLTDDQRRELLTELIKRVDDREKARRLLGEVYIHLREEPGSPLRELRSFATLLNACGRMGRGDVGVALAAGMRGKVLQEALEVLREYRRTLSQALSSVRPRVVGRVAFIDEGSVPDTMIGTLTSIKAREMRDVDLVVGYAETDEGMFKVSARMASGARRQLNLDEIMRIASKEAGGKGGGHRMAAGAQIPSRSKAKFENTLLKYLED